MCKQIGRNNVLYLSPMHISKRAINGDDVADTDPRFNKLDRMQRVEARANLRGENLYRKGQYVLEVMRRTPEDGCILAPHHFG